MNPVTELPPAALAQTEPPEYPSPSIVDSRRLLGPSLYSSQPGALLEVSFAQARADALLKSWSARARELTDALGWGQGETQLRRTPEGATLFLAAPVEVLMTATDANEQAWVAAESGTAIKAKSPIVSALRATADAERQSRPNFGPVVREALSRGLSPAFDDESLTLGGGAGSRTWPLESIPPVDSIPWSALRNVPVALVTGSNGKTTTTRLVAAMWRVAGNSAGWSCSDGVWVDDVQLESGDYSGPAGARSVLRDSRVEAAVLETARGGVLRRGLAVYRANAAIITNISADHFGEYGVDNLSGLTDAKSAVARVIGADGRLVLNADDPELVELGKRLTIPLSWFSVSNPDHPILAANVAVGGDVATIRNGRVMLYRGRWHDLGGIDAMPLTLRGAAQHNIENILGATLLGVATGVPVQSLRATLVRFGSSPKDNPGRLQVYRFGGVTILVDYAHNPDGLAALCETAKHFPAKRRLLLLGQAGNRDDNQLRALVRAAWKVAPFHRVVIKEMARLLRGRTAGDIARVLADELLALGLAKSQVEIAENEFAAVRRALAWARDGDLLVLPIHLEKAAIFAWFGELEAKGWKAGESLPA